MQKMNGGLSFQLQMRPANKQKRGDVITLEEAEEKPGKVTEDVCVPLRGSIRGKMGARKRRGAFMA